MGTGLLITCEPGFYNVVDAYVSLLVSGADKFYGEAK